MAYKLFVANEILTAADVNDFLMEQAVMVFSNAAARNTALTSVLTDGMAVYLQDVDEFQIRIDGAWQRMGTYAEVQAESATDALLTLYMEVI
jgi:uncharacterized protein YabE (DUF348 family)